MLVKYSYNFTPLIACRVQLSHYYSQYLYSTDLCLLFSVHVQYSYTSNPHSVCTAELYL